MKSLVILVLIGAGLAWCNNSPTPERKAVEISSDFLNQTFTSQLPLAYQANLARHDDVGDYIRVNSATLFAEEADYQITGLLSGCGNCLGKSRLTTPVRIQFVPAGTKFKVVGEYIYYASPAPIAAWLKSPTNIHMLIVKDENGRTSEISELGFRLKFIDKRFVKRKLKKEEISLLKNISKFGLHKELNFLFCPHDFAEKPINPSEFIEDFKLEKDVRIQIDARKCNDGYRMRFHTLESYLTSMHYFQAWGLFGKWHETEPPINNMRRKID